MNARKNVTVRQLELLIKFMENNNDLALSRVRVRSREGRVLASKLWRQCAKILNAEDIASARTPKEWCKFYNDYKCRVKKKVCNNRQSQCETGGGPSYVKPLTPLEERLYAIIEDDKLANLPTQQSFSKINCNNPIKIEIDNTASTSEPTEFLCTDQSLPGPSSKYLNIDNQIETNIGVQEDTNNNKERNKKIKIKDGTHLKESKLEKANNEIIEIEKEKLILKRHLLAIKQEKATALTSLANAAWALANVFKNQKPENRNRSMEC